MATPEQIAALLAFVNAAPTEDNQALADETYDVAQGLVDQYVGGTANRNMVPDAVYSRAVLSCGSRVWAQRTAPNGSDSYLDPTGAPFPVPRDPMLPVYPLLDPFLPAGFA